jgi:hypothetical protein
LSSEVESIALNFGLHRETSERIVE